MKVYHYQKRKLELQPASKFLGSLLSYSSDGEKQDISIANRATVKTIRDEAGGEASHVDIVKFFGKKYLRVLVDGVLKFYSRI